MSRKKSSRPDATPPVSPALTEEDWERLRDLLNGSPSERLSSGSPAASYVEGPAGPLGGQLSELRWWPADDLALEEEEQNEESSSVPAELPSMTVEEWRERFVRRRPGTVLVSDAVEEERAPTAVPEVAPAMAPGEWAERFVQRGPVTVLAAGDGSLLLSATDISGRVDSITLREDSATAVAALALQQAPAMLRWQDHDDLMLATMLLHWYSRGLTLEQRPRAVSAALPTLLDRLPLLMERMAALLPPR